MSWQKPRKLYSSDSPKWVHDVGVIKEGNKSDKLTNNLHSKDS